MKEKIEHHVHSEKSKTVKTKAEVMGYGCLFFCQSRSSVQIDNSTERPSPTMMPSPIK